MNAHSAIPLRAYVLTDDEREERAREEAWEQLREECFDEFVAWQREGIRGLRECENNPRDDEEFSVWLIREAHRYGGRYVDALNWSERALLGIDDRRKG